MTEASVKDVRSNLREYLDRAEAGEEIVVTRREPGNFPDLTEFRHSTELESDGPLEALLKIREETRY